MAWQRIKAVITPFLVFVIISFAGVLLDRILHRDGIEGRYLLDISNVLTGGFAAFLFWHLEREHRRHQRIIERQLQVVAEMNHHIRNALQVIAFYTAQNEEKKEVAQIREAAERIEWSLREVLPHYPERPNAQIPLPNPITPGSKQRASGAV